MANPTQTQLQESNEQNQEEEGEDGDSEPKREKSRRTAIGLAFAVPFGVLFAGVACTDRVMRSPLSQPAVGPQAEEQEEEEEEERELILSSCYESAADELLSDGDDKMVPTTKGLYSEENIWEQISAIRTIVGYKTPRRSSYIDEIRDLYVFTGIQPPLSFKDSSDFREIDEKLQCLKSVVGIK